MPVLLNSAFPFHSRCRIYSAVRERDRRVCNSSNGKIHIILVWKRLTFNIVDCLTSLANSLQHDDSRLKDNISSQLWINLSSMRRFTFLPRNAIWGKPNIQNRLNIRRNIDYSFRKWRSLWKDLKKRTTGHSTKNSRFCLKDWYMSHILGSDRDYHKKHSRIKDLHKSKEPQAMQDQWEWQNDYTVWCEGNLMTSTEVCSKRSIRWLKSRKDKYEAAKIFRRRSPHWFTMPIRILRQKNGISYKYIFRIWIRHVMGTHWLYYENGCSCFENRKRREMNCE